MFPPLRSLLCILDFLHGETLEILELAVEFEWLIAQRFRLELDGIVVEFSAMYGRLDVENENRLCAEDCLAAFSVFGLDITSSP